MEHSANAFAVSPATRSHDLEVVRLRQRTTCELLMLAGEAVAFPERLTHLQRDALSLVLGERARAFDPGIA